VIIGPIGQLINENPSFGFAQLRISSGSVATATEVAAGLPDLLAVAREAFTHGLNVASWINAGIAAGLAVLVLAVLRRPTAVDDSEAEGRVGGVVQSVARAFAILELFDARTTSLTAVEIAERTGLNRATAHRFCQTLVTRGYLQDVGRRHLAPGPKTLSLARSALASWSLPELARPHLVKLQEKTGEAVNLAVLDGTEVV
jgi:hypothetical protein